MPSKALNGIDPFAHDSVEPSLSCWLYRHADGMTGGPRPSQTSAAL